MSELEAVRILHSYLANLRGLILGLAVVENAAYKHLSALSSALGEDQVSRQQSLRVTSELYCHVSAWWHQ